MQKAVEGCCVGCVTIDDWKDEKKQNLKVIFYQSFKWWPEEKKDDGKI
jgi:hypothetical protein